MLSVIFLGWQIKFCFALAVFLRRFENVWESQGNLILVRQYYRNSPQPVAESWASVVQPLGGGGGVIRHHELRRKASAYVCRNETSAMKVLGDMTACFCGCVLEDEDGVKGRGIPAVALASDSSAKIYSALWADCSISYCPALIFVVHMQLLGIPTAYVRAQSWPLSMHVEIRHNRFERWVTMRRILYKLLIGFDFQSHLTTCRIVARAKLLATVLCAKISGCHRLVCLSSWRAPCIITRYLHSVSCIRWDGGLLVVACCAMLDTRTWCSVDKLITPLIVWHVSHLAEFLH
jgi:hypothetical protein